MVGKASIDGLDFWTRYSVGVTSIKGHLDIPRPKKRVSHIWDDEHGEDVYLGKTYFEAREIEMELFIKAETKLIFISKLKAFFDNLKAAELHSLKLGNISNVFLVYYKDSGETVRLSAWNDSLMVGTFKVRFVEPNPINRQFYTDQSTAFVQVGFTITCTKLLTIWWGDGSTDTVTGTAQVKTKTFTAAGIYKTVIYGDIDSITSLVTSGPLSEGLVDLDYNPYTTIVIGMQEFLVENWRCTKYADGSSIPNITDNAAWAADTAGAYCAWGNNINNIPVYGLLYNWHAVNKEILFLKRNGVQESGWRIITATDRVNLVTKLGGTLVAGGFLKEKGTSKWLTPNLGATDDFGMNLVPGGFRIESGVFSSLYNRISVWQPNEYGATQAYYWETYYNNTNLNAGNAPKARGMSCRLVRDL